MRRRHARATACLWLLPAVVGAVCPFLPPAAAVAASEDAAGPAQDPRAEIARYAGPPPNAAPPTHDEKLALLRQRIKYVFVLFQENRSFDQHFGTFPGADGLFSAPAARTPGFVQPIVEIDGTVGTISPFLIPQSVTDPAGKTVPIYPADTDSVDHSQDGIDNSLDVDAGQVARNDRYALNEEKLTTIGGKIVATATGQPPAGPPTLLRKQRALLVMGHLDCDTVPFLWRYADRFTLFDNFHQTTIGPSTPNAIAMIAGQSGETQWALHPAQGSDGRGNPVIAATGGEPMVSDPGPFPGSQLDFSPVKPPYNTRYTKVDRPALLQTYATLPLSFMGPDIAAIVRDDQNPAMDLLDVQQDITTIGAENHKAVPWGWYQEGYGHEPTDGSGPATHATYIVHHNGPQYFGYVGDNPTLATHLHGLADFFRDVAADALPEGGGVFYVRGGFGNNDGLQPLDPNPTVRGNFVGSDDHPGYSDTQIAEALLADEVNAIAASPYWQQSAIIVSYDETDGLYDHAVPHIRSFDPEGRPLAGGPRVPAMLISPFARAHAISHEYSEHSSVIRFIDELFALTPLADLPDEARGRRLGLAQFGQHDLGPADDLVAGMGDLFDGFDDARLSGDRPELPADYAAIPAGVVRALPHYGGNGCAALGIVPTDYVDGRLLDPAPADFNPRPSTTPGLPTSGHWTP